MVKKKTSNKRINGEFFLSLLFSLSISVCIMAKLKYRLNNETLSFEIHKVSLRKRFRRVLALFLLSVAVAVACFSLYSHYFDTPKLLTLRRDNAELALKLELLKNQIALADRVLVQLQQRDNNVYRPTFGLDEIPASVRDAGFGGVDRYALRFGKSEYARLLSDCALNLDKLQCKLCIQSRSFDTVAQNATVVELMVDCVPAIQPLAAVSPRLSSSFGHRKDPIYGDIRFHEGLDFTGKIGDLIFATGNGKVESVEYSFVGYGNNVVVDHGFGYKTRYAHLHSISVQKGQKVLRGEELGTLGNTGKSTAPHLHYEVLYRNNPVNPLNFFANDIESEDLANIMHINVKDVKREFE